MICLLYSSDCPSAAIVWAWSLCQGDGTRTKARKGGPEDLDLRCRLASGPPDARPVGWEPMSPAGSALYSYAVGDLASDSLDDREEGETSCMSRFCHYIEQARDHVEVICSLAPSYWASQSWTDYRQRDNEQQRGIPATFDFLSRPSHQRELSRSIGAATRAWSFGRVSLVCLSVCLGLQSRSSPPDVGCGRKWIARRELFLAKAVDCHKKGC